MKFEILESQDTNGNPLADAYGNLNIVALSTDGQLLGSILYPPVDGARDIALKRLDKLVKKKIEELENVQQTIDQNQEINKKANEEFVKNFFVETE